MENLRLSKAVRKIIAIRPDASGEHTATVVYETPNKKKKSTRVFRPYEKAERRFARAQVTYWDDYLQRHNRSNEKRRDGWLRDLGTNIAKASRKAQKELT